MKTGSYWIQAKEKVAPIHIKCETSGQDAVAIIDHDTEAQMLVDGAKHSGFYNKKLGYVNISSIEA